VRWQGNGKLSFRQDGRVLDVAALLCINYLTLAGGCGGGLAGEGGGRARLGKAHPGSTKLLLDSQNWGRGGPASAKNRSFGVAGARDNPSWGGVAG